MNAQQLKNAILQEAIEGRLVPQDPNDEPASVLLARIRKEKERLVKEGKLKKKDLEVKPISEDEIPFEIPDSWEWVRFFSVYNLETNLVSPQQYLNYNHVAPDNIEKGTGRLLHCNTVNEDKVKSNNHLFYEGQIVYSKIRPLLRKAIIAPFDGLCSADMYPMSTEMHSKYALLYLLSDIFNKQVSNRCSSRVKMPKINQDELSTILVPVPPLAEQHRIVAKIEELLPKVEEYGKAQDALNKLNAELPERLKKSILQEAIEGRLVPQDPDDEPASVLLDKIRQEKAQLVKAGKLKMSALKEIPFSEDEKPYEIPVSWEWCKLGWIGDWGAGATPAKGNPEYYDKGTIPWLRTGELNNGYLYDSEIKVTPKALEKCSLRMCEVGDVLIAMYGATIGKVAIAGIKLTTNQACCACTPYGIYNKYLMYYLMASKKTFIEMGEGGAQPNISREKIVAFPFALPPLAEQHRIVEKLEQLLGKIELLQKT